MCPTKQCVVLPVLNPKDEECDVKMKSKMVTGEDNVRNEVDMDCQHSLQIAIGLCAASELLGLRFIT